MICNRIEDTSCFARGSVGFITLSDGNEGIFVLFSSYSQKNLFQVIHLRSMNGALTWFGHNAHLRAMSRHKVRSQLWFYNKTVTHRWYTTQKRRISYLNSCLLLGKIQANTSQRTRGFGAKILRCILRKSRRHAVLRSRNLALIKVNAAFRDVW